MKIRFAIAALFMAGCATQPADIETAYISPTQYESFDCEQLDLEAERVSRRELDLHRSLKDEADTDQWQTAVGLILFWPALFFLEGSDDYRAAEYSRIKGEREALEKASIRKKCVPEFRPTMPLEERDDVIKVG